MFTLVSVIRRLLLVWGALSLCGGIVVAEDLNFEQRMDQTWRDAMNGKGKAFDPVSKSNFTAKSVDTKSALVKPFYFSQKFASKDFLTGNYKGSKNFWMGDFKYATKDVDTKGRVIPNATTKYGVKDMPVKTSPDAAKKYSVSAYPTKKSDFRGKSQDRITAEGPKALGGSVPIGWQGTMGSMTSEQVRDLLNKNK